MDFISTELLISSKRANVQGGGWIGIFSAPSVITTNFFKEKITVKNGKIYLFGNTLFKIDAESGNVDWAITIRPSAGSTVPLTMHGAISDADNVYLGTFDVAGLEIAIDSSGVLVKAADVSDTSTKSNYASSGPREITPDNYIISAPMIVSGSAYQPHILKLLAATLGVTWIKRNSITTTAARTDCPKPIILDSGSYLFFFNRKTSSSLYGFSFAVTNTSGSLTYGRKLTYNASTNLILHDAVKCPNGSILLGFAKLTETTNSFGLARYDASANALTGGLTVTIGTTAEGRWKLRSIAVDQDSFIYIAMELVVAGTLSDGIRLCKLTSDGTICLWEKLISTDRLGSPDGYKSLWITTDDNFVYLNSNSIRDTFSTAVMKLPQSGDFNGTYTIAGTSINIQDDASYASSSGTFTLSNEGNMGTKSGTSAPVTGVVVGQASINVNKQAL